MTRLNLRVTALVLGALVLTVATGCSRDRVATSKSPPKGGTAVVLISGTKNELIVVDLDKAKVASRHKLRSFALSIAADPASRRVVTAQCGGVGPDADDACGVFSLDSGRVDYIKLEVPNPLSVTFGAGKAWLIHGLQQKEGLVVSAVDVAARSVVTTHTPPIPSFITAGGGAAYAMTPAEGRGDMRTFMVPLTAPRPSEFAAVPLVLATGVPDGDEFIATGMRRIQRHASDARLVRFTTTGELVKERRMMGFEGPMGDLEIAGSTIAVAESDDSDPANTTGRIWYFDRDTFESKGRADVGGAPLALAVWKGSFVAVNGTSGELLVYEPGSKEPSKRIDLDVDVCIGADVVAFE